MTYVKPLEERAVLQFKKNDIVQVTGDIYEIREWIEELLEEKVGFFVSLVEYFDTDDKEYQVYIHTDNYEDLSEEKLAILGENQITDDPEGCTEVLRNLLDYTVEFSHFV